MQGLNEDEERQVLGEILADKLTVFEEYLRAIMITQEDIPIMEEGIRSINDKLTVFESILKEHEKDLRGHSKDIKSLKAKIA